MLSVKNLSKEYRKVKAVDHISFFVDKGEVAVLIGANGAGKSTTIQSIVGILRFSGDITIGDYDNHSVEAKRALAYVPEMPTMFPLLNVREHVEFMSLAYGVDLDSGKIDALLHRFDLFDKQTKLGDELSKGMMQKVSICCALIVNPDVLILDEPMVGLDPKAIKELKHVITEMSDMGKTILISTHMMEMVDTIWDRVILMNEGKIVRNLSRSEAGEQDLDALYFEVSDHVNEESMSDGHE